jgi:CRP-like cAMP-binding protein
VQLDPSAFIAEPTLLDALEKRATPLVCEGERILFRQGDPPTGLYILHKGQVTLSMDPGANQNLFACEAVPGSLLGVPGLIANQPYSLTAVARAGAEVSLVTRDDFTHLMQTDQQLMLLILQVLAAEVRSARLALAQL